MNPNAVVIAASAKIPALPKLTSYRVSVDDLQTPKINLLPALLFCMLQFLFLLLSSLGRYFLPDIHPTPYRENTTERAINLNKLK